MFERFADEARRATALASEEARRLGHDFIGTEHLLLGLLAAEGSASAVLGELEVTLDDAREKVSQRVHPYGSGSVESPPFTPLAKKVLERALREALQLEAPLIGSEHLLLGLIDVADGGGAWIVVELAGSADQVREAVLARIEAAGTAAPSAPKTLRRWAAQGRTALTGRQAGEPEPHGPPPRCGGCQASLATEARYRSVTVAWEEPGKGESEGPEPITVTLVYCGQCGVALGVA
ncbi:MAG: ATP-dependent Clp protease ATP-binding subunit ClpC [Acidimicrobiaceae bacterium]|jgi:ATP-dependent Clp protease ATP-binding subunit ClpA|nr:ATP-dependent Clp protease ATP-binding subunit ClpC [Acidimicrobiaceae bacterium]